MILIILRTTPEYILAYFFLLLWGPSMLPAIFSLFIHNGAILSFLTANNTDIIKLRFDNQNNDVRPVRKDNSGSGLNKQIVMLIINTKTDSAGINRFILLV